MKKISIVTRTLLSGGAERVISQLANYFVKEGYECSIVTIYKGQVFYTLDERVEIFQIDVKAKNSAADKFFRYKAFREYVKRSQPDVILALPEEIGIYAIAAVAGTGIPIVVSERNNPWVMPNKKITRLLRKLLYPFADGFVFQTRKAATFFSKQIQAKGIVLRNPLDLSRIPERYEGIRKKQIISVGRLERQKNFILLMQAFQKVQTLHPEYSLVVYGEGSQRKELEKYASENLPEGTYSFPGRNDDVLNAIREAACFVLSSDYEGVPNSLIEAMAAGIPCVSTDCEPGGAREVVDDHVNGFIVPIKDPDALANKICYLLENEQEAEAMSRRAVNVKNQFNVEVVGRQWADYLENVGPKK